MNLLRSCKDGLTKHNKTREMQDWFTKHNKHASRPLNTRFKISHTGTKRRLEAGKINRESGISLNAWCMRAIRGFLCNNIARMGLQNVWWMRDACEQSDVLFVYLQGWVYKTNKHSRWIDDRVMCWFFLGCYVFCNNFARWFQKIVACDVLGFSGVLRSFVTTLCLLNEDFGRRKMIQKIVDSLITNCTTPQTKILERWTKDKMRIFEVLIKGVITRFGPRTVEKSNENISSFVHPSKIFVWGA